MEVLEGKDKYKTQRKETEDLVALFDKALDDLLDKIKEAKKASSFFGRMKSMVNDLLNDDNE
jgi:hypothetical protein